MATTPKDGGMDLDTQIPEGWRPKEGDTIVGKVVGVESGWSDFTNDYYPILMVEDEKKGPVSVHAFQTTLKARLIDLRPVAGERIGIKYKGKVKTKDGKRDVAVYVVKVEGRDSAAGWDRFGTTAAAVSQPATATQVASDIPADDIPF